MIEAAALAVLTMLAILYAIAVLGVWIFLAHEWLSQRKYMQLDQPRPGERLPRATARTRKAG